MRFKKIYIEISNICNLQCSFCIQNHRIPKSMTLAEFEYVIQQIKPYTRYVYLHVLGEPLLHPLLPDFLDICRKEDIQVNITTNGTLLKERWQEIRSLPIRQMNISLHSYEAHHQKDYLKDIISCVDQMKDTYISYRLWCLKQGILDKDNLEMMEDILSYYGISMLKDWKPGVSVCLKEHVFLHLEEQFLWPSLNAPFYAKTGRCHGFLDMCAILCDGSVTPCCLDSHGDIVFGNIFHTAFSDILKQERSESFYRSMKQQHLAEKLCQRCSYRLRFEGGK